MKMIDMVDDLVMDEDLERLNKFYQKKIIKTKRTKLTEYYKFHIEIPRTFMAPTYKVLTKYHNGKRRIRYFEVIYFL